MDSPISNLSQDYLNKVQAELDRYEHPLFQWEASAVDRGIEVIVRLKVSGIAR